MSETPGRARFTFEAFDKLLIAHQLGRDQFQRDITIRPQMRGQKHCAHSALTEQTLEAIFVVEKLSDVTLKIIHAMTFI
jgi:hypothetical protein